MMIRMSFLSLTVLPPWTEDLLKETVRQLLTFHQMPAKINDDLRNCPRKANPTAATTHNVRWMGRVVHRRMIPKFVRSREI